MAAPTWHQAARGSPLSHCTPQPDTRRFAGPATQKQSKASHKPPWVCVSAHPAHSCGLLRMLHGVWCPGPPALPRKQHSPPCPLNAHKPTPVLCSTSKLPDRGAQRRLSASRRLRQASRNPKMTRPPSLIGVGSKRSSWPSPFRTCWGSRASVALWPPCSSPAPVRRSPSTRGPSSARRSAGAPWRWGLGRAGA